jgi:hypothetical protein
LFGAHFLALRAKNRAIRSNKKPFVRGWSFAKQPEGLHKTPKTKKPQGFLFRSYPLRAG